MKPLLMRVRTPFAAFAFCESAIGGRVVPDTVERALDISGTQ